MPVSVVSLGYTVKDDAVTLLNLTLLFVRKNVKHEQCISRQNDDIYIQVAEMATYT